MARITIRQRVIEERQANGQQLLGETSGTYSFRKGSNLARRLQELGLEESQVDVRTAARAGRFENDGWQLLIFSLPPLHLPIPETMSIDEGAYWLARAKECCPGREIKPIFV